MKIKASFLRSKVINYQDFVLHISFVPSKANLLFARSSKGKEAVDKAREISESFLKLKKPSGMISEINIKLSTPLELKYDNFLRKDQTVEKIGELNKCEVIYFIMIVGIVL